MWGKGGRGKEGGGGAFRVLHRLGYQRATVQQPSLWPRNKTSSSTAGDLGSLPAIPDQSHFLAKYCNSGVIFS